MRELICIGLIPVGLSYGVVRLVVWWTDRLERQDDELLDEIRRKYADKERN